MTEALTKRELEILKLAANGLANKQIGLKLFLSTQTVKNHMHTLLPKLGADSRAHAVAIGFKEGLLSIEDIED